MAKREAEDPEPDKGYITRILKTGVDIAKNAGMLVTGASAFGMSLVPLANWLGTTAVSLGF